MPFLVRPVTNERDAIRAYLAQQQAAIRAAVFGLSDDQAGQRPTASTMSLGTLVKHVTGVQLNWLAGVRAAPELAPRLSEAEQRERWRVTWTWLPEDALATVVSAYDASCAAVDEAIATVDLETPFPVFRAAWTPTDVEFWSVRWVWFHLIEELARHAGHADILREQLDGAMSWDLLAAWEDAATEVQRAE